MAAEQAPSRDGLFIQNKGQWPQHVKFMAVAPNMNLWITSKGVIYDFYKSEKIQTPKNSPSRVARHGHSVEMQAGNGLSFSGMQPTGGTASMFLGRTPDKWYTGMDLYRSVKVESAFPGIDIVYTFEGNKPRYDFHVAPGTDPSTIALQLKGAKSMRLNDGAVEFDTRFGTVRNGRIFAYQTDKNGIQKQIPCSFRQQGNSVAFNVGEYDKSRPLIIDPLVYTTYFGGSGIESINGIARDAGGNVIAVGSSDTPDLPVTTGVYDSTFNGGLDAVMIRYNPQFSQILSLTYIGGGGDDIAHAVITDGAGSVYIVGETSSNNFPISTAWKDAYGGGVDGFAVKVSTNGANLLYSTYLPGSADERALCVAVDDQGFALIGGQSNSSNFPTDNGAYQKLKKALNDGFMLKLRSAGSLVEFCSFIGGDGEDIVTGVGYDPSYQSIFVAGTTGSGISNGAYPTPTLMEPTRRPWQSNFRGKNDGFVAKFNKAGTHSDPRSHYLGYLGSNGNDRINGLTTLDDGTVIVCGETEFGTGTNTTFPVTNANSRGQGGLDAFVTRIAVDGRTLRNSSVFGTSRTDIAADVDFIESTSQVMVTGWTNSQDFPNVPQGTPIQDGYGGGAKDAFMMRLSNDFTDINFSSFYGGAGDDEATAIIATVRGDLFVAGITNSTNLQNFRETVQKTPGDGQNGFLAKVAFGALSLTSPSTFQTFCPGSNIGFNWVKSGMGPTENVNIQISSNSGDTWQDVGTDLGGTSYNWKIPDNFKAGTRYISRVIHVLSGLRDETDTTFIIGQSTEITQQPLGDSLCPGQPFRMTVKGIGKGTFEWYFKGNRINGARDSVFTIPAVKPDDAGDYTVIVNTGCLPATSQPARLYVKPQTKVQTPPKDITVNTGQPIELRVSANGMKLSFEWQVDGFKINNATDSVYRINSANSGNAGKYRVIVRGECGTDTSSAATVTVNNPGAVAESDMPNTPGLNLRVYQTNADKINGSLETVLGGATRITLISNLGQTIATIFEGQMGSGENREFTLPSGIPSGIYWISVQSGNAHTVRQISIFQ
jgi:hypothetical protein